MCEMMMEIEWLLWILLIVDYVGRVWDIYGEVIFVESDEEMVWIVDDIVLEYV